MNATRLIVAICTTSAAAFVPALAHAACDVSPLGTVSCGQDTATTTTTNPNGAETSSSSQTQLFNNGQPIMVDIGAGITISGVGLSLDEGSARRQTISLSNAGTVNADGPGVVALIGNGGPIIYSGTGPVTSSTDVAILARNGGDIAITADGAIRAGTPADTRVTPQAVSLFEDGAGNIVFNGAGNVTSPAGRGIQMDQGPTGTGGLQVSGTGDTAGLGTICPGVPIRVAKTGKIGCSGIRATIDNKANTHDILIDRSGNISGTSTAINAETLGIGNITVRTGTGAQILGGSEFGIEAASKGKRSSGSITIATGAAGTLTSGGNGIFANNLANQIPIGANSTIEIDAAGSINSGTFQYAALNAKNPTGILAGISAGYVGGPTSTPNTAVHGTVIVNNAAIITASSGSGILGYNFGSGSIHITNRANVTSRAGDGIDTLSIRGPTEIGITDRSTVTASEHGFAALSTVTKGGPVDVTIDAGATLRGADGAGGIVLAGAKTAHKAMIRNVGTIVGGDAPPQGPGAPRSPHFGGVGIKGGAFAIYNSGLIRGGMNADGSRAYAISLTGGANQVAGPGTIDGGINVTGTASFMPALSGSTVGAPLEVGGPLRFATTATYRIRLTPTIADSTMVLGAAAIKGAKVYAVTSGTPPPKGTTYTILVASQGVVGHFSGVTSDLAFYQPTLGYDATHVTLISHYDYRLLSGTQDEMSVGNGLNNAAAGRNDEKGLFFKALRQVPTTGGAAVIDSLSGEGITAAQNTAYRSSQLFNSAIFDQTTFYGAGGTGNSITLTDAPPDFVALTPANNPSNQPIHELADLPAAAHQPVMPAPPSRTWRVWATGFGGAEDIRGTTAPGAATQNDTIYGGALGIDDQLMPNYLVGVAIGGSDGEFSVSGRATSGTTTGGHVAVYDLATFGRFYGASSASFAYYDNQTIRAVGGFGGLAGETERGSFNSNEFRSRIEFGRSFDSYGATLTPFAALELAKLCSNGFNEQALSGSGLFALNVSGQSTASVPGFVGLRFQHIVPIGNGMILSPTLEVAYIHEFAPYRSLTGMLVNLPGSAFFVDGARPARAAAEVKAGGQLVIDPNLILFANFDSEFSEVDRYYGGKGGVRYFW